MSETHSTVRPKSHLLLGLSLALLALNASGCGTPVRYALDSREDQPLIGGQARAIGYLTGREEWLQSRAWLEWADSDGRRVDRADGVVLSCQRFLDAAGRAELADPNAANGVSKVIVSLEPTIVLIGPARVSYRKTFEIDPIPAAGTYGTLSTQPANPSSTQATSEATADKGEARLPWGYFYGTSVAYSPECLWFCPEVGAKPQPAEIVQTADGSEQRIIRAGKATLKLKRAGAFWKIAP